MKVIEVINYFLDLQKKAVGMGLQLMADTQSNTYVLALRSGATVFTTESLRDVGIFMKGYTASMGAPMKGSSYDASTKSN